MKAITWCKKHKACSEAIEWIKENNIQTMHEAWEKCERSDWMLWVMDELDYGTDKQLRLFAVWDARQTFTKDTDKRSIEACDVAEKFANGQATREELSAAGSAARSAAESAAWSARSAQATQLRKMFKNPFK